ncbi:MAG: hypothetical protein ACRBCK_08510 [Alphaproteobacteria bacterium]
MVDGFKGRVTSPFVDGVWGERSLPRECLKRRDGFDGAGRATGQRDATGERSISLATRFGRSTKHSLRNGLNPKSGSKPKSGRNELAPNHPTKYQPSNKTNYSAA